MNKSLIPMHLKDLAINIKNVRNTLHFRLKCPCGNEQFSVWEMGIFPQKKFEWPTFSSDLYVDKEGKQYYIEKTFFKIPIRKVPLEQISISQQIIKAKCLDCGQEFVLFDSSKHGYDALCNDAEEISTHLTEENFQMRCTQCGISVCIQNDLSYNEFEESFGNKVSPEQYANAFSSLAIYSLNGKKKKNLYSFETM